MTPRKDILGSREKSVEDDPSSDVMEDDNQGRGNKADGNRHVVWGQGNDETSQGGEQLWGSS